MDISSGGAIAVDPDQLREMAARVDALAEHAWEAARLVRAAATSLFVMPVAATGSTGSTRAFAEDLAQGADALGSAMRFAADAYELVELRARLLVAGGDDGIASLQERARQLEARSPGAGDDADRLLDRWRREHGTELLHQLQGAPEMLLRMFGLSLPSMLAVIPGGMKVVRDNGLGRIPRGARLHVQAPVPRMLPGATTTGEAPRTLAELTGRVPDGDDATIRVERYAMPDGRNEFALYVAGTQFSRDTVLDWDSNLRLYRGRDSQAYRAAVLALADAGAVPGDTVHAAGFSQGGIIATWLAAEADYDVRTLVTLGAPVEADLGDGTRVIALRHDDDPVALLSGGGFPFAAGSEDSVLIEDTFHPQRSIGDVAFPAHRLDAYVETARRFEDTGDGAVGEIRERLAALAEAESVEVYHYRPERSTPRADREGGTAF